MNGRRRDLGARASAAVAGELLEPLAFLVYGARPGRPGRRPTLATPAAWPYAFRVTTEALPGAAPWPLPFGGGVLRLFDLLRRAIRRGSLAPEQRELLDRFDVLSAGLCDPILEATTGADLQERLDIAMLGSSELFALCGRAARTLDLGNLERALLDELPELPPAFEELLGGAVVPPHS